MSITEWTSLALICFLGAASPGPSLAVIGRVTLSGTLLHGLVASISHAFGVGLYALLTILGLASVLKANPMLFKGIVYSGAAYLFWIGTKAFFASFKEIENNKEENQALEEISIFQGAKEAFAVAFLNPKLAIFFAALFSQFIDLEHSDAFRSGVLVGTVFSIDMLWYILVSFILIYGKQHFSLNANSKWVPRLTGIIFISLAVRAVLA